MALATTVSSLLVTPGTAHASPPGLSPQPATSQAPPLTSTNAVPAVTTVPTATSASAAAAAGTSGLAAPAATDAGCGGALALGQIATCPSIVDTDTDAFTVVTTVDQDTLYTTLFGQSTGAGMSAIIASASGTTYSCYFSSYPSSCKVGAAGVYTITVSLLYGTGTGNYALGVESMRTPSACTTLQEDFFSFASPAVAGMLPAGSSDQCYTFDQPQGALVYLETTTSGYLGGSILDGQYQPLCSVQYPGACTLSRPGPYHLFVHEFYGRQASYTLRMPRISNSVGCQFAGCLTIPADQHASRETIAIQRTAGTGVASIAVYTGTGVAYCGSLGYATAGRSVTCTLPDGPLTVLVEASAVNSTFQVTRSNATTTNS